jgi:cell wall-associated NlpC family hydrolase
MKFAPFNKFIWIIPLFIVCNNIYSDYMVVKTPVANVRSFPIDILQKTTAPALSNDTKSIDKYNNVAQQVSQILLGDIVKTKISPNSGEWVEVKILNQRCLDKNNNMHYCSGFVKKKCFKKLSKKHTPNLVIKNSIACIRQNNKKIKVSMGTRLYGEKINDTSFKILLANGKEGYTNKKDVRTLSKKISTKNLRKKIIKTAKKLLGVPYVWGGRSAYLGEKFPYLTGVDCSRLIHLVFSTHGIDIPCNSKSQYFSSHKIAKGGNLQPGDLIFFISKNKPPIWSNICHVALYIGNRKFIEAYGGGVEYSSKKDYPKIKDLSVRISRDVDLIGCNITHLKNGKESDKIKHLGKAVFFGSFLT